MSDSRADSFTTTLALLARRGLRYGTVVDVGCADGSFYLSHLALGLLPGAAIVNIDANPLYEDSLKAIKDVVGGHYVIAAVSDHAGEVEMAGAAHPYWSSLRPAGDAYWHRMNAARGDAAAVKAVTLDGLMDELALAPPYLLKLDVQGAERAALDGGRRMLAQTSVVICEADLLDFQSIHACLADAGFALFDLTDIHRQADGPVGWFYPVYLSRRLDDLREQRLWDPKDNARVIAMQEARRQAILEQNARMLRQLRASRRPGTTR